MYAQVIQVEQMSVLFREGDATSDVYIVRSGNIQLRTGIDLPRYVCVYVCTYVCRYV